MTDYPFQLVREANRDFYISLLFAPKQKHQALAAIMAFNIEIARIARRVHDPLLGEIRLRWWRDTIEGGGISSSTQNPVADGILAAISQFNLPRQVFLNACDARLFDLYDDVMQSRHDFEGYCGESSSAFIQLACQVVNPIGANDCADASGHGGVALALCDILRQLPTHFANDQKFVPTDLLQALGIERQALCGKSADKTVQTRALAALIAWAREHYLQFLNAYQMLPPQVRSAYLPIAPIPYYLETLERLGVQVFEKPTLFSPLRRQWIIMKTAISGRFPPLATR